MDLILLISLGEKFSPGIIVWSHYLSNVSPVLQAGVDMLSYVLGFRVDV